MDDPNDEMTDEERAARAEEERRAREIALLLEVGQLQQEGS